MSQQDKPTDKGVAQAADADTPQQMQRRSDLLNNAWIAFLSTAEGRQVADGIKKLGDATVTPANEYYHFDSYIKCITPFFVSLCKFAGLSSEETATPYAPRCVGSYMHDANLAAYAIAIGTNAPKAATIAEPALVSRLPDIFIMPNTKLSQVMTVVSDDCFELKVSRAGSKKVVTTKVILSYNGEDISITGRAKFTAYDREVQNGVATLYEADNEYITPEIMRTKGATRGTEDVIVIKGYLIRQIEWMKSMTAKKRNTKIAYDRLYAELDVTPDGYTPDGYKDKTRRIRKHATAILNSWADNVDEQGNVVKNGYIKGHAQYMDGHAIKGVIINLH